MGAENGERETHAPSRLFMEGGGLSSLYVLPILVSLRLSKPKCTHVRCARTRTHKQTHIFASARYQPQQSVT